MSVVLIAGAGERGIELIKILKNHNVIVDALLDNDSQKQGKIFDGIPCYSVDYFKNNQENCIVFVSPFKSDALLNMVSKIYSHVVPEKILSLLFNSPYNVGYTNLIVPIGHYYSTYPDAREIVTKTDFAESDDIFELSGIEFNEDIQKKYLAYIMQNFSKMPKWKNINEHDSNYRYRRNNPSIPIGDAIGLFTMIQILRPSQVIEVGSGYTSAMLLDLNEIYMDKSMTLTFIEPYPEKLKELLKPDDDIKLLQQRLQDVPMEFFETLYSGDVLFVDSTHVAKEGSDVNYLFFEILPKLREGVVVHLHDIFYPFTYPHDWGVNGRVWNETYLLRAFLQYNNDFEILYSQNYVQKKYKDIIAKEWQDNEPFHGASFWIKKK